jgi:ABC-2 type transport system permease protein
VLAWIVLYPQEGTVITSAPELGLERQYTERFIRERTDLYARKFLGRLRGKIRD